MAVSARRDVLVGVTEARERLKELLDEVGEKNVVVLRRNQPVAVMVHPDRLEKLMERIEDLEDTVAVLEERLDPEGTVPVTAARPDNHLLGA